MKKIYEKLAKIKVDLKSVKKSADNSFFESKYADLNSYLEEVEPLIEKNKLVLTQPCLVRPDGKQVVLTTITDVDSGESVSSELELLMEKRDMQKLGSAVTYARRYTLGSLLAMKAEDDDGNSASGNDRKPSNKNKSKDKKKEQQEEF